MLSSGHENPDSPFVGAPAFGGSRVDKSGGIGSPWVGPLQTEQPYAEHGSGYDGEGGLLFRALQWAARACRGFCVVRPSDVRERVARGSGQEQAGGAHFGAGEQTQRRLAAKQSNTIYPSFYRKALCLSLVAGAVAFGGCAGLPKIKLPGLTVQGPKENGSPAVASSSEAGETLPIPQGSRIVKREIKGLGYRPALNGQPAREETPAETITEITLAGPSLYTSKQNTVNASTGTVDTSIAKKKIDAAENRWLLWAAIGCGIGGVVLRSMLPAWGGLSNGLLIGAALAFASWKLAEIPPWIWAVAIGIMVILALGYKRAEWDKDGDGRPDFLQKPKP
jgi:hypothetical protein